jgi:argonaute-like protein implicated in RNA metabolism and viral defense
LVLKGGRATIDKNNRSPYLSKDAAFKLMTDVLNVYKKQMRQLPARLVVHKSSRYRPEELAGLEEASRTIKMKDFVTVLTRGVRFMRSKGIYPPVRGTVVKVGDEDYILFTKGWIPYFKTYPGLRVPRPIEVVEHHGDTPLRVLSEEILALTKMNWNSADFCIREPITLAYSREVGKVLAYVPEEVIPRPEYLYYM